MLNKLDWIQVAEQTKKLIQQQEISLVLNRIILSHADNEIGALEQAEEDGGETK